MADLINNLIDFKKKKKMDCITNYLHEHSGRICNRLWISSPFISSEKIFYYIFQISKIKKHKPNFRLLTDLNNISINNYKILKLFLGNNCELRSLKKKKKKMYLMDDYSVVTSANMTYRGLYVNYETGVAGDILDVDRFEAMYNEIWELGTPVNQEMLDEALNNSTYIDDQFSFATAFDDLLEDRVQYGRLRSIDCVSGVMSTPVVCNIFPQNGILRFATPNPLRLVEFSGIFQLV